MSVFLTLFLHESSHASCLLHPSISVHLCLNLLSENRPVATLHDLLFLNLVVPPTTTLILLTLFFSRVHTSFTSSPFPLVLLLFPPCAHPLSPSCLSIFPLFVFSLFYSTVFPSTESSHVQRPDAAGCHNGVKVSIQFTSNPCGCQHPAPSHHTRCGYCHMQPTVCRQSMAQHCR